MHTPLCKHAMGEPELYVASAIERGLDGIIFTCHSPMPDGHSSRVRMMPEQFDDYVALIERARIAAGDELVVRLGMESDYFPGLEPWLRQLHDSAPFDYLLGSVHYFLEEWEPIFPPLPPHEPSAAEAEAYFSCYFEHLAASAETGLFDALAHSDLVKSVAPKRWSVVAMRDCIAAALDRIAATGVAMELNTSGRIKSFSEFNPNADMLEMMCARDIPVVLGSDSHHPLRVGADFEEAVRWIERAGYECVSVYCQRKREDVPLDVVRSKLKPGWTRGYALSNRSLPPLPAEINRLLS